MDLSSLKIKLGLEKQNEKPTNPTPLRVLFYLYENANHADVYCDYMAGARVLIQWLAPFEIAPFTDSYSIPRLLHSYEMNELAKHIGIHPAHLYQEYTRWLNEIHNQH